ncbi:glycosyltransferase [Microbacterium sp. ZXX196]|uniref:glycosyltransferase n=1 Tax=Microbacterium sp. ZXX196 TaxID=2609291 RepID=UPI001E5DA0C1|nr:glycosyltransferase [Microbacterium sp. ZXX196]
MNSICIIQPYIPNYRLPFFDRLRANLDDQGIQLTLAAGSPQGSQRYRRDAAGDGSYIPVRWTNLGPIHWSHSERLVRDYDAVIYPLIGTDPALNIALLPRRNSRRTKIGVWGHIGAYVNPPNPVDQAIETWQMRRADHVFAYTERGLEEAVSRGVNPDDVTAVQNTIDTEEIARASASIEGHDVAALLKKVGATPERTMAYIGALDSSKRVDLLADALEHIWAMDSSARVLLAGAGDQRRLLDRAIARGQVLDMGYADASMKALIGQASSLLLNPGRVGLNAVDALVLRLPILTVSTSRHAPEVDYLTPGSNLFSTPDDPHEYAVQAMYILKSMKRVKQAPYPTIDLMVSRFSAGIYELLRNRISE